MIFINTVQEFMSYRLNENYYPGEEFKLMSDLDFDNVEFNMPSYNDCSFDGNGYTIKNIKKTSASEALGVFGGYDIARIGAFYGRFKLRNITLENIDLNSAYAAGVVHSATTCQEALSSDLSISCDYEFIDVKVSARVEGGKVAAGLVAINRSNRYRGLNYGISKFEDVTVRVEARSSFGNVAGLASIYSSMSTEFGLTSATRCYCVSKLRGSADGFASAGIWTDGALAIDRCQFNSNARAGSVYGSYGRTCHVSDMIVEGKMTADSYEVVGCIKATDTSTSTVKRASARMDIYSAYTACGVSNAEYIESSTNICPYVYSYEYGRICSQQTGYSYVNRNSYSWSSSMVNNSEDFVQDNWSGAPLPLETFRDLEFVRDNLGYRV